jgi:tetratricopeptide (TPR) repeat protein
MNWAEYLGWSKQQMDDLRYTGYLYLVEGKYSISSSFFEAIIILDPGNIADLETLGALYLEEGNSLGALNLFNRSLQVNPDNHLTLINKAKALFNIGQKKQALVIAKMLLQSEEKKIKNQAEALVIAYS